MSRFVRSHEIACLSVLTERKKLREDSRRAGGAATWKVVAEHAQGMYHRQQLEDVGRVRLLRRR